MNYKLLSDLVITMDFEIELLCIMLFLGKPKSGKSHLIDYFMYLHQKQFDYGLVFSKTAFTDGFKYVPKDFIHSD